MAEFELDTPAYQIVHWLRDELAKDAPRVLYSATREYVAGDDAGLRDAGLDADAEAHSMVTVGLLEVWPAVAGAGWRLSARIEDAVGSHLPEDDSASDEPEDIDLDDFDAMFVGNENATEYVSVCADSQAGRRRFDRIFADISQDRHSGRRGR